jgi:crotonobetainyl-CoA:carnitine CoA-transferase CaiB-like acyl-CoA transferase
MSNIFDGVRVLDFTNNLAGPQATAMMADFGAEVIKVERPGLGDDARAWPLQLDGMSTLFIQANRGKKSIVLDFKKEVDLEIIRKLVQTADVVVEAFSPGVMDRAGLGYGDLIKLNPSIIMCSVSAYGQTGPYKSKPGYDLIAQALSGVMSMTGNADGPPMRCGPAVADYITAYHAFGAISAALFYRERSGEGQHIDVSLLDCMTAAVDLLEIASAGGEVNRNGNHNLALTPYGIFGTKGNGIMIAALNPKLWNILTTLMGRPDLENDPRFSTVNDRSINQKELIPIIHEWVDSFDNLKELEELLDKNGVPCGRVQTVEEVMNDPHLLFRETITEIDLPHSKTMSKLKVRGTAIKFSKTPGKPRPAPTLGQNQDEIPKFILGK